MEQRFYYQKPEKRPSLVLQGLKTGIPHKKLKIATSVQVLLFLGGTELIKKAMLVVQREIVDNISVSKKQLCCWCFQTTPLRSAEARVDHGDTFVLTISINQEPNNLRRMIDSGAESSVMTISAWPELDSNGFFSIMNRHGNLDADAARNQVLSELADENDLWQFSKTTCYKPTSLW